MRPARWLPKAIVAAVFGALAAYALLFRVTMPGARHAVLWIIMLQREHDASVSAARSRMMTSRVVPLVHRRHKQRQ